MPKTNNVSEINSKEIDKFIDELLKAAEMDKMPEEFKQEYKTNLGFEVQRRLGLVAMGLLDSEAKQEYLNLLTSIEDEGRQPEAEEITNFLSTKIPDFEDKMRVALEEFGRDFIRNTLELRKQTAS